ncbi:MAG: hypothetical protein GY847_11170 [Proteobacteria bacterium]|nr:hypothetical protein [Pseudomonadota bacterium]
MTRLTIPDGRVNGSARGVELGVHPGHATSGSCWGIKPMDEDRFGQNLVRAAKFHTAVQGFGRSWSR